MPEEVKNRRIRNNKVVTENHLNFLLELHIAGVDIGADDLQLLKDTGFIVDKFPEKGDMPVFDDINHHVTATTSEYQKNLNKKLDILEDDDGTLLKIITDADLEKRRLQGGYIFQGRSIDIEKEEWMPASITEHTKEFVDWISSINLLGFSKRRQYQKLTLYCQQAYAWLSENKTISDFDDETEQEDFMLQELKRCDENTLYFANKYGYYKEGNAEGGRAKYIASPAHEIVMYLDDCGYSVGTAKGRQMAYTTTKQMCNLKSVIFKKNFFIKFVTEDKEKAQEIFEDKLKFPFSELPNWMQPTVLNDRENFFKLGSKEEKGDRDGVNSSIRVVAPKRTVIAGGAPNKADIDEAGNINILSKMIEDQRPTMLWFNPKTGKIEIKRQLSFYGTGGEMDKGGKAFETEFMAIWTAWQVGNFSSCIIPLFLDWTARPGATQEDYDREKRVAYAKVGPEQKDSIVKFHQTWPSSLSDVFKSTGKTLVDEDFIKSNLERIKKALVKTNHQLTKRGYFEPIYDESHPNDEHAHTPFRIIGANFIPTDDFDARGIVTIFMEPDKRWVNRYFQGTDPIMSDSGLSNMATAIWDKQHKTISCIVNFRSNDPRETFLQCTLAGLYYDTEKGPKTGVKELTESNIGPPYCQYRVTAGFERSIVLNYELPSYLQNHSTKNDGMGVDNKTPRTSIIINKLHELFQGFGERLFIETIFTQLETFVCHITGSGNETWGPSNKKYFRDDVLFACVYAYICAEYCYPELIPMNMSVEKNKFKWVAEYYHDEDWKLCRRMTKKPVNG